MAISPVSFNTQTSSTSKTGSKPQIDPDILAQLQALGLQPTGSKEGDLAAINAAKTAKQAQQGQNIQGQQQKGGPQGAGQGQGPPPGPPPWESLMQSMGLSLTGSKEGDFAAINQKISEMEASAKTDSEKQNVSQLKSQYQAVQSQANAGGPSQGGGGQNQFTGMTQLAEMNKLFMLK